MNITNTTTIPAAAPAIWDVLTDYEDFKTWNPFVTNVALDKNGKRATLRVDLNKYDREQQVEVKLRESETHRTLSWDLLIAPSWLLSARYVATLTPEGEGAHLKQELRFGGVAKGSVDKPALRARLERGLERMAAALRAQMRGA